MAYFIRTRRLDIQRLDRKPQESLDVVRAILTSSIKDVLDKLRRLEKNFYGSAKTPLHELRKWVKSIKSVLACVHRPGIASTDQISDVIQAFADPKRTFSVEMYDVNKLKECYRKIQTTVPEKFGEILTDLKTTLKYLKKYCLSFVVESNDECLETASHYEKSRQEYSEIINENTRNINVMCEKFRTTGLNTSDLSSYGIDLARRGECTNLAFLLIFPEACENIRLACSAMTSWIDADANYVNFIRNDVTDLESLKAEKLKLAREAQQKYHQLGFRLKQLESDCDKMEEDIDKLSSREADLIVEHEALLIETNDIQLEIEMSAYRRDELVRNAAHMHPQVLYEKYSELSENLRELKARLPYAKREQASAAHKLSWIEGKKAERKSLQRKVRDVRKEMEAIDQTRQEFDIEYETLARSLQQARKILLYKDSTDAMEKIFNERPVAVNRARLPGNSGSEDPLERACDITSTHIEADWPRLYRALPFHPSRGVTTVDRDIRELSQLASRTGIRQTALRALSRWRRHHTRAKLEDLKEALSAVKRGDILQLILNDLEPPRDDPGPADEEVYAYVEEYLIPFVKEVERFDELRAANKI